MANLTKVLAQAFAPTTAGQIYAVPSAKHAYVKAITLVNVDSTAHWVKLWVNGTTDAFLILPQRTLGAGESADGDGLITLAANGVINAQADALSKIAVAVMGLEMDGAGPA